MMSAGTAYFQSLAARFFHRSLTENDLEEELRSHIQLPIGVGFGIRDAQTARAVAHLSDAVVIGSRLVQEIETSAPDMLLANVRGLVGGIRKAIDE